MSKTQQTEEISRARDAEVTLRDVLREFPLMGKQEERIVSILQPWITHYFEVCQKVERLRAEQAQSSAISKAETTEPRKSEDGKFVKLEDGWTCLEHDTLLCTECATPQSWMADAADEIIPEYEGDVIPENDVESIIAKHYASSKEHDLLVRMAACIKEMYQDQDHDHDLRTTNYYASHKLYDVMPASDMGLARILGLHPDIIKYAKEWKGE